MSYSNRRSGYKVVMRYNKTNFIRGAIMTISYDKHWKLLIDKKPNRTESDNPLGTSFNVQAEMRRNEFGSLESMCKTCPAPGHDTGEIMEFVKDGVA